MLNENIKRFRKEKGLTQKDLADKVGISGAFMSLIEKGVNNPSDENLKKIADVLGVSVNDLNTKKPSSPLEELISLLIELTEKETISWEISYIGDGSDNFTMISKINNVNYIFGFMPYENKNSSDNVLMFDSNEYHPKTDKEYQLFRRLYDSIMVFHNVDGGIYKSINDLKNLLDKE